MRAFEEEIARLGPGAGDARLGLGFDAGWVEPVRIDPRVDQSAPRDVVVVGEPPGDEHALLRPVGAHREEDGVEEERRETDLVEVAALEGLEALAKLLADPRGGRLRQLAEPGLLAERLDVAHREAADEGADHHRPQRLGPQHLRGAWEQPRGERLGGLSDLGDLDRKLPLQGLHLARAKAVAKPAPVVA